MPNSPPPMALCPECNEWSEVAWDSDNPPGGWWWADKTKSGCPECGALVCVESECEFRGLEAKP